MEDVGSWFKPDCAKPICPIENMARLAKRHKRDTGAHAYWRMNYAVYHKLQEVAHSKYGCNLKRALRKLGVKNRVKHQTRNGYWVWMK